MTSSPIILAIAPGTRRFGIAVFDRSKLVYYSVKSLNPKNDLPDQVSELLKKFIQWFSPQVVVIKEISQYQKLSNNLEAVVQQIKTEAKDNDLSAVEITIEQIKTELCRNKKQTQQNAFEFLVKEYPALKRFSNRPNKWQNDYYAVLFSAVAVGAVYLKTRSEM